jgi:Zn-dependent peptidase ImmA (M78 family)
VRRFIDTEQLADEVLQRSGAPRLSNAIAIDVEAILREYCKFDVAHVPDLELDKRRLLGAYISAYGLVMVEANMIDARKRFTMAHELGHVQMEFRFRGDLSLFQGDEPTFFRCDENDVLERPAGVIAPAKRPLNETLANKFAAHVLMPKGLVIETWRRTHDERACASALGVSREALGIRLQSLGMRPSPEEGL